MQHYNIRKQYGYIFMIVLIALSIITVLQMTLLKNAEEVMRMANSFSLSHQFSNHAESAMHMAEANINNHYLSCTTEQLSDNELLTKDHLWWTKQCTGKIQTLDYYYVVEKVYDDPCAFIDKQTTASFYRLSLYTENLLRNEKRILQSVWVAPNTFGGECKYSQRTIKYGRQSLREIM